MIENPRQTRYHYIKEGAFMDALQQINAMLDDNENVLWYGKPNKKCFLLEAVFNPLLPFALLWGLVDFAFIGAIISGKMTNQPPLLMLIAFFALHLMPVWIYIAGVLLAFKHYKNTCFVVTEKGIYLSGGFFTSHFRHKAFDEIENVSIRQGFFDRKLNVGDVLITGPSAPTAHLPLSRNKFPPTNDIIFHDIPEFTLVYHLLTAQLQKQKK